MTSPTPSSNLAIDLAEVVVKLGEFPALAGLSLSVGEGELVVLRGPNGAGKTTLLRLCAGLHKPHAGRGAILGYDITSQRSQIRKSAALLGHANFLYDDLSVHDNVEFIVKSCRGDTSQIGPTLELLGLSGRLRDLRLGACSAGQRRRTALAGLIARKPKLWLLDEPHTGLDASTRDLLDTTILAAVGRGATIVLASHEAGRFSHVSPRTVTVAGGHVLAAPQEPDGLGAQRQKAPDEFGVRRC